MSERILRALMQLFAIIAKDGGEENDGSEIVSEGHEVVEVFLRQQLSSELVQQYLEVYQDFLNQHHKVEDQTKKRKKTSVNSVKVLKICTEINAELTQKQKAVVLIRLIEFINKSGILTEQELEFVSTVSSTFNIGNEEYERALKFAAPQFESLPDSPNFLFISSAPNPIYQKAKTLISENLQGEIRVLSFGSVGMYFCRYFGKTELYINGSPLIPERIYILTPGSSIRSSKVAPIYYSDIIGKFLSEEGQKKISFVARELEYKFKGGKYGLHKLNFREESGKLIGIMGGSGAGKSTLLNILNGNDTPTSGEVLINGYNLHTEKEKLEGVIGYVSQDDLLIEELTVFQNLFYNAKLCFADYSDERITLLVNRLLTDLGLYETAHLKVGSPLEKTISGGQRKRLNIGLELIREPSVLFVDEPTSGLSSRDSENIMDLLKELALKGKLVFVVIHQPSSDIFKMFDKLLILDLGGYPIYYNNPVEAVSYFKRRVNHVNPDESECPRCGNVNPEQIFNIIEMKVVDDYGNPTHNRKISPKEWNEEYLKSGGSKTYERESHQEIPPSTFKVPTNISQYKVFITRDVLSKLTNRQYMLISLLEAPLLSFILAFLVKYYKIDLAHSGSYVFRENENIVAFIFMSVVVALFIGLTVSAEEIIKDRKILKRESFLNLSRGSYLASKITIMFVLSAIQTLSYILVGNTFLGIKGMYTDYFLILFSTSCFANILGLNISASFNSAITIYILIPFLIIPQLLLSGLVVKFEKLNPWITNQELVPFTGDLMASRWAFEALVVNQFKNNKFEKYFYKFDKIQSQATFKKDYWLKELEKKVNRLDHHFGKPEYAREAENDLNLLANELAREAEEIKELNIQELITKLRNKQYTLQTSQDLQKVFSSLKKIYIQAFNKAGMKKDEIIYKLEKEDKAKFLSLKDDNYNQNLEDLVKNATELDKVVELKGRLLQRSEPIFKDGDKNQFIRAHFYAPRKCVGGKMVDTYWVNLAVIWLMTLVLIVTLYFDALRKLLDIGEKLKFIKKNP